MTGLSAVDRGQTNFPLVAAFSKVHSTAQVSPIRFLNQLAGVPVPMAATTVEDEEVSIPSRHWHRCSRASPMELALGTLLHQIFLRMEWAGPWCTTGRLRKGGGSG